MTSISITALKGKTIREILELIHQAESLPENHRCKYSPNCKGKTKYCELAEGSKPQTAQEIIDEIKEEEK